MKVKSNFSTFLLLRKKKIVISAFQNEDLKNIYHKEMIFNEEKNFNVHQINEFLEINILEIEKILDDFVKKINLILESVDFLKISFSLKKKNYGEIINKEKLMMLLNEAKSSCKKTIDDRKIIHMLIDKYLVDEKEYKFFPNDRKCKFFSIEISFICLSKKYYFELEQILKRYQVSIDKILQFSYVNSFLTENHKNVFEMSMLLADGYNKNEVLIIPKKSKNIGFFERFFKLLN